MTEQEADMTEEEAQVWAARLTRIWAPETSTLHEQSTHKWLYDAEMAIDAYFESHFWLEVFFREKVGRMSANWSYKLYNHRFFLVCRDRRNLWWEIDNVRAPHLSWPEPEQSVINRWMDFFRRGCWLSGCPIEASAHEKAEWMQGFTPEEIEAWNIKL
jgi:hypothetical protein